MTRPLLVSLLLHVLWIAVLLTIRKPEPFPVLSARVTPIASPYRTRVPITPQSHVRPHLPIPAATRTFRVPDRLPPALPQPTSPVLDAPPSLSLDFRPPEVLPLETALVLELAPRPHPKLAATGGFDAAVVVSEKITPSKIISGTFGDANVASGARTNKTLHTSIFSAAEILSKPRPAYTDEARRLQIEGAVLLEVLFGASGQARVLRTIRGLGHGLDENAVSAAREIRFRPAQRDGAAVDSAAVVRIVFQLAY
jgi:TonB family protein